MSPDSADVVLVTNPPETTRVPSHEDDHHAIREIRTAVRHAPVGARNCAYLLRLAHFQPEQSVGLASDWLVSAVEGGGVVHRMARFRDRRSIRGEGHDDGRSCRMP